MWRMEKRERRKVKWVRELDAEIEVFRSLELGCEDP